VRKGTGEGAMSRVSELEIAVDWLRTQLREAEAEVRALRAARYGPDTRCECGHAECPSKFNTECDCAR